MLSYPLYPDYFPDLSLNANNEQSEMHFKEIPATYVHEAKPLSKKKYNQSFPNYLHLQGVNHMLESNLNFMKYPPGSSNILSQIPNKQSVDWHERDLGESKQRNTQRFQLYSNPILRASLNDTQYITTTVTEKNILRPTADNILSATDMTKHLFDPETGKTKTALTVADIMNAPLCKLQETEKYAGYHSSLPTAIHLKHSQTSSYRTPTEQNNCYYPQQFNTKSIVSEQSYTDQECLIHSFYNNQCFPEKHMNMKIKLSPEYMNNAIQQKISCNEKNPNYLNVPNTKHLESSNNFMLSQIYNNYSDSMNAYDCSNEKARQQLSVYECSQFQNFTQKNMSDVQFPDQIEYYPQPPTCTLYESSDSRSHNDKKMVDKHLRVLDEKKAMKVKQAMLRRVALKQRSYMCC